MLLTLSSFTQHAAVHGGHRRSRKLITTRNLERSVAALLLIQPCQERLRMALTAKAARPPHSLIQQFRKTLTRKE